MRRVYCLVRPFRLREYSRYFQAKASFILRESFSSCWDLLFEVRPLSLSAALIRSIHHLHPILVWVLSHSINMREHVFLKRKMRKIIKVQQPFLPKRPSGVWPNIRFSTLPIPRKLSSYMAGQFVHHNFSDVRSQQCYYSNIGKR